MTSEIEWPDGKDFAFTVFDDTDNATRENVAPVYELLGELGLRTTKSVWAISGSATARIGGATCAEPDYRAWTLGLQASGFEIGSHGATNVTSNRDDIIRALDTFRDLYGHDPHSLANHADCGEAIYWGPHRVSGAARIAYDVMTGFRRRGVFRGHLKGDPLFWGDVCRDRVRYVRNFTYRDINTLAMCPVMPYHDPDRPYVNRWFAASEGPNLDLFNRCLAEENQDRLEAEGGACIIYTHFASGFRNSNGVDRRFKELMKRLASKNGWFVPVATLLDYLAERRGTDVITGAQRRELERRWLVGKAKGGVT